MKKIRSSLNILIWAIKTAFKIHPIGLIVWFFLQVVSSIVPVIFIKLTEVIVDAITTNISNNDLDKIIWLLLLLVLFYVLNSLSNKDMFPTVIYRNAVTKISLNIREKIIYKINQIPLKEFDNNEFVEKLHICCNNSDSLAQFVCDLVCSICTLVGTIALLISAFTYSWIFFILCLLFMILHIVIACINGEDWNRNRKLIEKKSRISNYYYNLAIDRNEAKNIRSLDLSKFISKKWVTHAHNVYDIEIKHNKKEVNLELISKIVKTFANVLIMGLGAFLILNGRFTLGMFIAIQQIFNQVYNTSENGAYYVYFAISQVFNLNHIKNFLEIKVTEDIQNITNIERHEGSLYFLKNVDFFYKDHCALKNINLCINKGEIIALVGANGAGKSTLVKLFLGLYKPEKGIVLFENKPINLWDREALLKKIGIVFQDFSRYELSLRENIAFGNIKDICNDEKLIRASVLSGADHIVDRNPNKLDVYLGKSFEEDGIDLSGGEWQRVAVSRVHLSDKEILIMDEPASALDPIAEYKQFTNLKNNLNGRTAILISHRIGFVRLANKIIVLDQGEIKEIGSHEELLELNGLYSQMFQEQSKWYNKIFEGSNL